VGRETDSEDETLAFVRTAISSVCALELLILLRQERHKCWRPDEIVRELRSSQLAVAQALAHLTKTGLVEEVPELNYRYQQGSAQLDAVCQRLESEYARKPVTIIRAILEAPNEKLRVFADAFRFSERNK
jgi:predicted DNA-binding transcriptional regulator